MNLRSVALTICAATLLGSCAILNDIARGVGKATGTKFGSAVAESAPAPKAASTVTLRGGTFCDSMIALGWPDRLTPAEISALSDKGLRPIVAANRHGRAEGCW